MQKIVFTAVLGLGLAGCSADAKRLWNGIGGATVPGYAAVAAAQAFDGSELVGAAYLNLPLCTTPQGSSACHVRAATPIIKGAFQSGRIARDELKVQVRQACAADFAAGRECVAGIPVASYNTLVAATRAVDDATAAWRAATGK